METKCHFDCQIRNVENQVFTFYLFYISNCRNQIEKRKPNKNQIMHLPSVETKGEA